MSPSAQAAPNDLPFFDRVTWTDRFTEALPADPDRANRRRQVAGAAYSWVDPTPTAAPRTLAVASEVADLLGIDEATRASADFAAVLSGNRVPAGARPYATAYGGHQFGNWAGQLGDGRAIALGELTDRNGQHQILQLKGAGPTPYSRTADGRAVLRSSIREFLCSEAMAHLGVATTRALSLVATGDQVVRDVLYDGNPAPEPGAVVCRVAPSFTRFGHFQLPASRGDLDLLRALVDTTIRTDFAHLLPPGAAGPDGSAAPLDDAVVEAWYAEVCDRTADLVVDWMRVGFVHGVLNTDNLSITGLTIDYGPYGWLEAFEPDWTPNTTDAATRRYRYGAQPAAVHWNLLQLANAIVPLLRSTDAVQATLNDFGPGYQRRFEAMVARRLGWGEPAPGDDALVERMFELLQATEVDQVLFFRDLARVPTDPALDAASPDDATALLAPLTEAFYRPEDLAGPLRGELASWLVAWARRARSTGRSDGERIAAMDACNPRFVLRNYLAAEAIDAATAGDLGLVHELLDVLRRPYDEQPGRERFSARRPEWARTKVGCSMLSCSS